MAKSCKLCKLDEQTGLLVKMKIREGAKPPDIVEFLAEKGIKTSDDEVMSHYKNHETIFGIMTGSPEESFENPEESALAFDLEAAQNELDLADPDTGHALLRQNFHVMRKLWDRQAATVFNRQKLYAQGKGEAPIKESQVLKALMENMQLLAKMESGDVNRFFE